MSTAERRKFTVPEFLAREAISTHKHWYYDGEIFAMSGGSEAHNIITDNLLELLFEQLRGQQCRPRSSNVLVNAASLYTYPDIVVTCPPVDRESGSLETILNPKLLIEVLSQSTERHDRNVKFPHYQQVASVDEILLVQQDAPAVEHYSRQPDGTWVLTMTSGLHGTVVLPCIACKLPMERIYATVEFPPTPFTIVAPGQ